MIVQLRKCIVSLSKPSPKPGHYNSLKILFFSSSEPSKQVPTAEFLTTQHHISPETALKASSAISHLKNPKRTDSVLACLKQSGFSEPQIERIIHKYPKVLSIGIKNLRSKLRVFEDHGFSSRVISDIVSQNPWILCRSADNRIGPSITALKTIMGSNDAVCKVLKRSVWILQKDLSKTMIPNIEYLKKTCGFGSLEIFNFMLLFPRIFLQRPESVVKSVKRIEEMGFRWSLRMLVHAIGVVCSMSVEKLELKIRFFQGLGFSEDEVLRMFRRCPLVFTVSEKKITEGIQVWLRFGRADSSLPVKNPELLMYSIDKRVKPRLEVIEILEDKGFLPKKLKLSTILILSNKKFLENYVLSNSDALGDDNVNSITKKLGIKVIS